jgi:thymidylate synthase
VEFKFSDINEAYMELHIASKHFCEWEKTRNGDAFVFQQPVLVTHKNPLNRVLFDPVRDANPFFHFMEAIWMLSGSNDVKFPARFAKNIANYSDDGKTIHGAYGYRWRHQFRLDQLEQVIWMLQNDSTTRRAVLTMWDPNADLDVASKDLPCNTHIYFREQYGELSATICNRSNDMVWGMLGANYVHFGVLLEYVANACDLHVGHLHQFSNNLHIYAHHINLFNLSDDRWYGKTSVYDRVPIGPKTLNWQEAKRFVAEGIDSDPYTSELLNKTALPMLLAWEAKEEGELGLAIKRCGDIYDEDWRYACEAWLLRRLKGKDEAED